MQTRIESERAAAAKAAASAPELRRRAEEEEVARLRELGGSLRDTPTCARTRETIT